MNSAQYACASLYNGKNVNRKLTSVVTAHAQSRTITISNVAGTRWDNFSSVREIKEVHGSVSKVVIGTGHEKPNWCEENKTITKAVSRVVLSGHENSDSCGDSIPTTGSVSRVVLSGHENGYSCGDSIPTTGSVSRVVLSGHENGYSCGDSIPTTGSVSRVVLSGHENGYSCGDSIPTTGSVSRVVLSGHENGYSCGDSIPTTGSISRVVLSGHENGYSCEDSIPTTGTVSTNPMPGQWDGISKLGTVPMVDMAEHENVNSCEDVTDLDKSCRRLSNQSQNNGHEHTLSNSPSIYSESFPKKNGEDLELNILLLNADLGAQSAFNYVSTKQSQRLYGSTKTDTDGQKTMKYVSTRENYIPYDIMKLDNDGLRSQEHVTTKENHRPYDITKLDNDGQISPKPVLIRESLKPYDMTVKIILLGDYSVGKTRFLRTLSRINDEDASGHCTEFREGEIAQIVYRRDGRRTMVKIIDTGGQEKYRSLTSSYFRGAHGCLLLFDVSREDTFNSIMVWYQDLSKYSTDQFVSAILVGTVSCLKSRTVPHERGVKLAEALGIKYTECSLDNVVMTSSIVQRLTETIAKIGLRLTSFTIDIKPKRNVRKRSLKYLRVKQTCACI